jgi:predicted site-specific integrase-resolvase
MEKATLTEREFCEAVGIHRVTAFRLRRQGKLPHCKIGSKIVYLPRHIEEFLRLHEQRPEENKRAGRARKGSTL